MSQDPEDDLRAFFEKLGIPEEERNNGALDIANTPGRITRMFRDELLASYRQGALEELKKGFTTFPSDGLDSMVLEGPIDFHSTCAHHCLPFSGEAYVAYIPGELLIGASKLPRLVNHYAKMLQIQERLGRQIAEFLQNQAYAKLAIVLIDASHLCMRCRGVKQHRTRMVTTAIAPHPATWEEGPQEQHYRGVLNEFYAQLALLTK